MASVSQFVGSLKMWHFFFTLSFSCPAASFAYKMPPESADASSSDI